MQIPRQGKLRSLSAAHDAKTQTSHRTITENSSPIFSKVLCVLHKVLWICKPNIYTWQPLECNKPKFKAQTFARTSNTEVATMLSSISNCHGCMWGALSVVRVFQVGQTKSWAHRKAKVPVQFAECFCFWNLLNNNTEYTIVYLRHTLRYEVFVFLNL